MKAQDECAHGMLELHSKIEKRRKVDQCNEGFIIRMERFDQKNGRSNGSIRSEGWEIEWMNSMRRMGDRSG
ncbi:unnamed protein product [Caenorhabditis bovis]|uniref:Uncharacterized protein n=1 Tax=Caenorhabditis bovis TaxID=2654633 RepID=A0A8S1EKL4_9PELO|nr:unnamed protein product [Caenorhabditis bovis]